jgi:hypothetical protein
MKEEFLRVLSLQPIMHFAVRFHGTPDFGFCISFEVPWVPVSESQQKIQEHVFGFSDEMP